MTQLEGCIRFWKSKLTDRGMFEPSTAAQIEWTIRFLELANSILDFPKDLAKERKL